MVPEIWRAKDIIFVILDNFLPFYSPDNPENQNLKKNEKNPGGIIILHICTINENHTRYGAQRT